MRTGNRGIGVGFVVCLALLAAPGSAAAVNVYVDDGGTDAGPNDCQSPSNPCKTLLQGITRAGAAGTVFLGGGTYTHNAATDFTPAFTLDDKSLIHSDFDPPLTTGTAIVQSDAPPPQSATIELTTGTLSGLTIRGDGDSQGVVDVVGDGTGTISNNVFDSPNVIDVIDGFGAPTVTGNHFASYFIAVESASSAAGLTLTGNTLTGAGIAGSFGTVQILNHTGTSQISRNDITLATDTTGIYVTDASADLSGNVVHAAPGATGVRGLRLVETPVAPATAAALADNTVSAFGHGAGPGTTGVEVDGTTGAVTMNSDLIADFDVGLVLNSSVSTGGDAQLTNETITGSSGNEVEMDGDGNLALNSSDVGGQGIQRSGAGDCTIAGGFDNIETSNVVGTGGCASANFATHGDPQFIDLASGNFHLKSASPLLDDGDPAAPTSPFDIDGDARALDSTPACGGIGDVNRRDVGADEFVPPAPTGCPAPPSTTTPPVAAPRKKKCKKHKKRRQAAASKKCKKHKK